MRVVSVVCLTKSNSPRVDDGRSVGRRSIAQRMKSTEKAFATGMRFAGPDFMVKRLTARSLKRMAMDAIRVTGAAESARLKKKRMVVHLGVMMTGPMISVSLVGFRTELFDIEISFYVCNQE